MRNFENGKVERAEGYCIIPPVFFDTAKSALIVQVPLCTGNEVSSKQFTRMFHKFTRSKFDLRIKWITRKTETLFKLKNKCLHRACKT